MPTKNYAMYLRKSRADIEAEALGEGETLARHRSALFKLAEKMEVLPSQITVYQEIVSGESIAARPEMQKLLNDIYQKKYVAVFCMEVERLARGNTKDQGEVSDAFQYSNTKIITPVKVYDPSNEYDQEYFEFGLFMSRREYKTIRRRMEAGRMASISEGNYVASNRPYGYDIVRNNKKERTLVPRENEAVIVRQMFDWFTEDGLTCGQISNKLTEMHIPTMTGQPEWNRGTVKDILCNIHYTGQVRWFRRKVSKEYDPETGKMSKTKRRLTDADIITYPGKHPALISQEQFDKAQAIFSTHHAPVKASVPLCNPLQGILVCKKCGKSMRTEFKETARPRYKHLPSKICTIKSCDMEVLNNALIDGLKVILADFALKVSNDTTNKKVSQNEEIIGIMRSECDKLESRRQKLFDAFEDGAYTKEEFIERKQILNQRIEDIKKQIQTAESQIPVKIDYKEKIENLHHAIELIKDDSISAVDKNRFLKSFIDRIDYDCEDLGRNKGTVPILDIYLK